MMRSFLLLALIIFAIPSCSRLPSTPTDMGYIVPALTDWQQDKPDANGEDQNTTSYTKIVGTNRIKMTFKLIPPRSGERPDDADSLRVYGQKGLSSAKKLSPKLEIVEEKETVFRSLPAYLTHTKDKFGDTNRERKILRVADGKNTFLFDQTLVGNPISDDARKEADAAWNKISNELKIPDGS